MADGQTGNFGEESFRNLSHDVRNQLSNITLCIEQLKHELPFIEPDVAFYLETISFSCNQINQILAKHKDQLAGR